MFVYYYVYQFIIILIQTFVRRTLSASELNLRRRYSYHVIVIEHFNIFEHNYCIGMCGNRISVRFRFIKTRTEPKPKGQIRNFGFRGFSQNRICFIHIVNIKPFSRSFNILHVTNTIGQ